MEDGGEFPANKDGGFFREVVELFNAAGWQRLTAEELKWIREPRLFPAGTPVNGKEEIARIGGIAARRKGITTDSYQVQVPPSVYEVFHTAAVFTDKEGELPDLSVASEENVREFINYVKESGRPLGVADQFEKLIELADGSVTDAAAIGMMASRMVARNLDKLQYPNIKLDTETQEAWEKNLFVFEDLKEPQDPLGDNYYFWTRVYMAAALSHNDAHPLAKFADKHSARIMTLSRQYFARQPTKTSHEAAAGLGRAAADSLVNVFRNRQDKRGMDEPVSGESVPAEQLAKTTGEMRVAVLAGRLGRTREGGEVVIPDPKGIISEDLSSFNFGEYVSGLPGLAALGSQENSWRAVFNRVRILEPAVFITVEKDSVRLRKEEAGLAKPPEDGNISLEWVQSRVNEINPKGQEILKQWMALGVSHIDKTTVNWRGQQIRKEGSSLETFTLNPGIRREYFTDTEWEAATDVLCACLDAGNGFTDESMGGMNVTVFQKARNELVRSVLILPGDAVTPRISPELLEAVENFDPTKASRRDKLLAINEAMLASSWEETNRDELDILKHAGSGVWTTAVMYLRQNVLEVLGNESGNRRTKVKDTISGLIQSAKSGSGEEKHRAEKALEAIYKLGMQFESHPVYSLFAVMHDPSLYGTARYRLERKIIKPADGKLPMAYARELVRLMDKKPKDLLRHQRSLLRRLSCPSCYGYAAGMEAQAAIQSHGPDGAPADDPDMSDGSGDEGDMEKFAGAVTEWIKSESDG